MDIKPESGAEGREIVESDRNYFELGARTEDIAGARLAWMPGLAHVPAGAVVDWLPSGTPIDERVILLWESHFRALGAKFARLYIDDGSPEDGRLLHGSGYLARIEIAYSGKVAGEPRSSLRILPATSPDFWEAKLALHEAAPDNPSGNVVAARDWVDLERRKSAAGEMRVFLAENAGEVAGAFGVLRGRRLFRLKNLVIHPAWRRRGLASDILRWITAAALAEQRDGICMLAVAGGAGDALYRDLSLGPAGTRTEWMKPL